jgi:hypothetical protein
LVIVFGGLNQDNGEAFARYLPCGGLPSHGCEYSNIHDFIIHRAYPFSQSTSFPVRNPAAGHVYDFGGLGTMCHTNADFLCAPAYGECLDAETPKM